MYRKQTANGITTDWPSILQSTPQVRTSTNWALRNARVPLTFSSDSE